MREAVVRAINVPLIVEFAGKEIAIPGRSVSREFIEAFRAHVAKTLAEVGRRKRG